MDSSDCGCEITLTAECNASIPGRERGSAGPSENGSKNVPPRTKENKKEEFTCDYELDPTGCECCCCEQAENCGMPEPPSSLMSWLTLGFAGGTVPDCPVKRAKDIQCENPNVTVKTSKRASAKCTDRPDSGEYEITPIKLYDPNTTKFPECYKFSGKTPAREAERVPEQVVKRDRSCSCCGNCAKRRVGMTEVETCKDIFKACRELDEVSCISKVCPCITHEPCGFYPCPPSDFILPCEKVFVEKVWYQKKKVGEKEAISCEFDTEDPKCKHPPKDPFCPKNSLKLSKPRDKSCLCNKLPKCSHTPKPSCD